MHHAAAHLVGIFGSRGAIDPAQERLEPGDIVGINEKIDEHRHTPERFVAMPVHGVSVDFALPFQRDNRVPDMRRFDVAPVQIRRVAADRQAAKL